MSQKEFKGTSAADLVKEVMAEEKVNQTELAERMGCVRQNISQALNRGITNMRFDTFEKMVEALKYEVIVRKK